MSLKLMANKLFLLILTFIFEFELNFLFRIKYQMKWKIFSFSFQFLCCIDVRNLWLDWISVYVLLLPLFVERGRGQYA